MKRTLRERFDAKWVIWPASGCWVWLGKRDPDGYGRIAGKWGRSASAHRVAYELYIGAIPDGLIIDHVRARGCITRCCVNPSHLEPVTYRENALRGWRYRVSPKKNETAAYR